jgi:hypothetical protein
MIEHCRDFFCIATCTLWLAAAGEPAEAAQGGWKVEPDKARGVFAAGEDAVFILEGGSGRPAVRVLDLQGQEAGKPEIQEISPGRLRLAVKGLRAGHHRLFVDAGASSTGGADSGAASAAGANAGGANAGAAAGAPLSFAVLPEVRPAARGAEGAISCDAAISWLVARRGSPESPVTNPRDVADCLHLARLAGLGLLRDRIAWGEVEPRPGEYAWGRYDAVATASKEAGLAVYQILHASPYWSRADHEAKRMPDDLRCAHRFARAAAERFRGRVVAWETWNEPDIPAFSQDPADQLAAFQKVMYLGFKSADPEVLVLMVSLAHPPGPFIDSFLENETVPYFEVYNYHTYDALDGYARRANAHAEVAARFGAGDKPVWVTEAGIPIKTPAGDLSLADAVRQAEFVPKAYAGSLGNGVSRHFFFILVHYIENNVQFGLLEKDLRPGPGYSALAALAAALGAARDARALRGLPAGMEGWLFSRGDGLEAAVVWAEKGEADLPLAAGIELYDLYGRALEPSSGGTFRLGEKAAFLVGKPEAFAAWKPEAAAARPEAVKSQFSLKEVVLRIVFPKERTDKAREAWRVDGEGLLAGSVQVYNFSPAAVEGAVEIGGAPGLAVDPARKQLRVEPGQMESLEIKLRWGESADAIRKLRAVLVVEGPAANKERSSAAVARIVKP